MLNRRGCSRIGESTLFRILIYIKDFCDFTTLHGFKHIVKPERHWLEALFWVLSVFGSVTCAIYLILSSWYRYQQDPTVVSLEKDYRNWNISFPALTLCYMDKVNKTKAEDLIRNKWDVDNGKEFDYYMDFLTAVANVNFDNLGRFGKFKNDTGLHHENLAEIMKDVNYELRDYRFTNFAPVVSDNLYHETLTEMGICYSYNSYTTPFLRANDNISQPIRNIKTIPTPPQCSFLNSLCYGRMENIKAPITYYVHSPFEVPDSASKNWEVLVGYESDTSFNVFEIFATPALKSLSVSQRKCAFRNEANSPESPYYSFQLCRMNCRRKLSMELCNCVPHFYTKRANQPFCNITGLLCLSQYTDLLVQLVQDRKKYTCKCFASCSETEYFLDKRRIHFWKNAAQKDIRFRWAIDSFAKLRFKRDILYGIDDLLVSFGGTAGLFLGCSILSGVEMVYYFTLRMVRHLCQARRKVTSKLRASYKTKLSIDDKKHILYS